nr:choice-of-anchor X domain-containing protein [Hyalangium sp. s54d21]
MSVPLVLMGLGLWWGSGQAGSDEDLNASSASEAGSSSASARGSRASGVAGAPIAAPVRTPAVAATPALSSEEAERQAQRELWEKRLQRARFTLDTYVAGTRYPPQSRPMREHPDQDQPAAPERTRSLSRDRDDVKLKLKQDKVFVAGDEVVHFAVGCENTAKQPLPCQVTGAMAREAEHMLGGEAAVAGVPLAFVDDGTQGDTLAGDGTYTASFQPSKQGFPMFSGTLRIAFQVSSGNAQGNAFFDILYTPAPPARFTGKVREAVEQGSLSLYLGLQVRKAGRYVMAGRVDDEAGVPFAYVSFNEELAEGAQEVKFTLFGKLLLDEAPTFPLKLRDVEGFLLKETGDPDRELLTALRGYIHTTREHPTTAFSSNEWQSEERTRHIDEFTKDVNEAQKQLDSIAGVQRP